MPIYLSESWQKWSESEVNFLVAFTRELVLKNLDQESCKNTCERIIRIMAQLKWEWDGFYCTLYKGTGTKRSGGTQFGRFQEKNICEKEINIEVELDLFKAKLILGIFLFTKGHKRMEISCTPAQTEHISFIVDHIGLVWFKLFQYLYSLLHAKFVSERIEGFHAFNSVSLPNNAGRHDYFHFFALLGYLWFNLCIG